MRWLIDGFNLLHVLPDRPREWNAAREWLIRWLPGVMPGSATWKLILDARKMPPRVAAAISDERMIYVAGQSADAWIEYFLRHDSAWTVVSNDHRVREAGWRWGKGFLSCQDFIRELELPATRSSPSTQRPVSDKPETPRSDDLQEWERIFGADKSRPV
jgi:uncharacterized protein